MAGNTITDELAINIDGLITSMTRPLSEDDIHNNETTALLPFLHRIMGNISDENKCHYEPAMFSIGPYHHGSPQVQAMQKLKYECLFYLLEMNHEKQLADYLVAMKRVEQDARSYYRDDIKMERNSFLKMLLLDGCFVLVFLLRIGEAILPTVNPTVSKEDSDYLLHKGQTNNMVNEVSTEDSKSKLPGQRAETSMVNIKCEILIDIDSKQADSEKKNIHNNNSHDHDQQSSYQTREWYLHFLIHDVLLVENQIPFCVVQKLHELVCGSSSTSLLQQNIIKFVDQMMSCYQKPTWEYEPPTEFHHFLHLFHMYFQPRYKLPLQSDLTISRYQNFPEFLAKQQRNPWHHAIEYHKAGIEFRKREPCIESPHSLLDIVFSGGVLEIPSLTVMDTNTECLFRNLIAFEKSCPKFGNYFTAYIMFWTQFVSTPSDFVLLTEKGIIEYVNNDVQVINFFKSLGEGNAFDFSCDHYLKPLCYALEAHCQSRKPKFKSLGLFPPIHS